MNQHGSLSCWYGRQANALWRRASCEGFIGDCIEISQMMIKLRVLDSSGRLVNSITQLNRKSATRNSELEIDGVNCKYYTRLWYWYINDQSKFFFFFFCGLDHDCHRDSNILTPCQTIYSSNDTKNSMVSIV